MTGAAHQRTRGDIRTRGGKFNDVSIGVLPFVIGMFIMVGLLLMYPQPWVHE